MNREHQKTISEMYENDFVKEGKFGKGTTDSQPKKIQSSELTGGDGVKIRSYRAAVVCLVLLCVLLLTAVIALCVTFTQEKQQILTKITNLAEERDQLLTNNMNLTEERNQLLTNNMNLTKERNQLLTNNMKLTEERNQLKSEKNELQKFPEVGWQWHRSSLYFLSSEIKNWSESRRYCTDRGTDLIIINNREEQDFVNNIPGGNKFWIGLTDIDVEGRWKWVDGSNVISGFWQAGEPNSYQGQEEDCALNNSPGWADFPCNQLYKWICEKSIFK